MKVGNGSLLPLLSLRTSGVNALPARGGTVIPDRETPPLVSGSRTERRLTRGDLLAQQAAACVAWQFKFDGMVQSCLRLGPSEDPDAIIAAYGDAFDDMADAVRDDTARFAFALLMFLPLESLRGVAGRPSLAASQINLVQATPPENDGYGDPCWFDLHAYAASDANDQRLSDRIMLRTTRFIRRFFDDSIIQEGQEIIDWHLMMQRLTAALLAAARPLRIPENSGGSMRLGGGTVDLFHGGTIKINRPLNTQLLTGNQMASFLLSDGDLPLLRGTLKKYFEGRSKMLLPTSRNEGIASQFSKRGDPDDLPVQLTIKASRSVRAINLDAILEQRWRCMEEDEVVLPPRVAYFIHDDLRLQEQTVYSNNQVLQRVKILKGSVTAHSVCVTDYPDDPTATDQLDPHYYVRD